MKKLYRVDVSVMVMAESEYEALIAMNEEVMGAIDFVELGEASEARSVPSRWYAEIPFNADDELKCSEILKREREQRGAG